MTRQALKNEKISEFKNRVASYLSYEYINTPFILGNVRKLEINGRFAYLWQDGKGNICYTFDPLEKEYFTTSIAKLSNALSSHFGCTIEAVNNISESFKKINSANMTLNKAIIDKQRQDSFADYSNNNSNAHVSDAGYKLLENMSDELNISVDRQPAPMPIQPVQQIQYNQEQLQNAIINLSVFQVDYNRQVYYILLNELPIVHKEKINPSCKQAFYLENGLTVKNKYIPSVHLTQYQFNQDIDNSFILAFIFAISGDDVIQAMKILVWLVNGCSTLAKAPYALVLHGENDEIMNLFCEEIVEPYFNKHFYQKITSNDIDVKTLSKKLDEMVIYNFHNITTPTIFDNKAKELTKRLVHKDDCKLNNKLITTVGSVLITSISSYIPLIAKDVPCLTVKTAPSLEKFCKDNNISINYYEIANYIKYDLDNFVGLARSIDLYKLNTPSNIQFYSGDNSEGIIDGDVEILSVFYQAIMSKDKVLFEKLKTKYPKLYKVLVDDFEQNIVNRKNLIHYFTALFGEDLYTKEQYRKFIADLRALSSTDEPFECTRTYNINGVVYYYL